MAGQESDKLVVLKPAAGAGRRPPSDAVTAAADDAPRARTWIVAASLASIGWLALVHRYVAATLGWDAFDALRLHEQAQIGLGAVLPVAGLWLALAHVLRGRELRDTVRDLRSGAQVEVDSAWLPPEADWKVTFLRG